MSQIVIPQEIWGHELTASPPRPTGWLWHGFIAGHPGRGAEAPQKLTRGDILDEWPEDFVKPADTTLGRWLDRAVELCQVAREGKGRKSDPYRYWLPEREAVWKETQPFYEVFPEQRRQLNLPFESLREHKRKLGDDHPHPASECAFPDEREGEDE